jgi:hypothetical protein
MDSKITERLNQVLGKSEMHTKIGIYPSGERRTTTNIPDDKLVQEVEYDVQNRWGRALFVDEKYIYKGHLTEEKCLEIEKEYAEKSLAKKQADAEEQQKKDALYRETHCFCEVATIKNAGDEKCSTCGKTLRPESE